jgi:hypothetical protein
VLFSAIHVEVSAVTPGIISELNSNLVSARKGRECSRFIPFMSGPCKSGADRRCVSALVMVVRGLDCVKLEVVGRN